jgi:hypothetical protein
MVLVLVVGGLVGFTPAPASAAPICYGGSCDYWDPGTAGCTPGTVRSEMTIQYWRYKVMYSSACNAGWAEVTNTSSYCPARYLHLQVRQASTSGSPVVSRRVANTGADCVRNPSTVRTTMASFNYWLQTCASNLDYDIFPAGRCTGIV